MTKLVSQVQAVETGFLRKVHDVPLCDKVCSCEIRKTLNVKPRLFRMERSQLRCLRHKIRILHERLAMRFVLATPTEKGPRARPKSRWCDYNFVPFWCGDSGSIRGY